MTTPTKPPKKRFIQSKASFTSPFSAQWSPLPQEDMHFILKTLKDKLVSTGIQKKEDRVFRPWRKKKGAAPETPKVKREGTTGSTTNGWTDVSARRQLAIGINEVTRALERNELQLALVCKSVKPKHVTEHLVSLSASRAVPACQVPRLSVTVREPLGLKSVLALGFRRAPEGQTLLFTDVIEAITPRVPVQRVAWLQSAAPTERPPDTEEEESEEKRGLKRKLEESNAEPSAQDVCTLLPLKVKKIVPNPDKKRKEKMSKSKKL
ncbi:ribonuclease P protein subunit p38 [Boleophthalmus pectinirostris]|uniref:ribonuclease P protein subunit p38 n=1 Tax=Boleophthalmus pectinirostris TaxID=150288 RepID=UPI000A1C3047|nr:ribonuclease P protein subunit p38 [Boleophthalmus pectinirostris]XP_020783681.1 ribonuclease P protein subunit p38 [Boleophthalmus pectinirostris]